MTTFYSFSSITQKHQFHLKHSSIQISSQTFKYSNGKLTSCSPYCQTKVPWSNGSPMLFLRSVMPSIPPHQHMNLPFLLCNYLFCSVHFSLHLPISNLEQGWEQMLLPAPSAIMTMLQRLYVTSFFPFFLFFFFLFVVFLFHFFYIFYIHIFLKKE